MIRIFCCHYLDNRGTPTHYSTGRKTKGDISIHGLRVEPDYAKIGVDTKDYEFQSTGSVWSPTSRD